MAIKWYCLPHHGRKEVGSYKVEGELTDFSRGLLMAYGNCCLTVGFNSEEEAREGLKKYPCKAQELKERTK